MCASQASARTTTVSASIVVGNTVVFAEPSLKLNISLTNHTMTLLYER